MLAAVKRHLLAVEHCSAEPMSGHARACSEMRVMLATPVELLKFNARSLDDESVDH
jgi:hypothetical protein